MKSVSYLGVILLFILLDTALLASQELIPEGVWLHSNKRIRVQITPCGERLCGKIVWLKYPNDETGVPLTDSKNPERARRTQPIMGKTVIRGLVRSGARQWTDGTIYNPDDGKTYSAHVTVVNPDTLHVRAYVVLSLFGKTQVWKRIENNGSQD